MICPMICLLASGFFFFFFSLFPFSHFPIFLLSSLVCVGVCVCVCVCVYLFVCRGRKKKTLPKPVLLLCLSVFVLVLCYYCLVMKQHAGWRRHIVEEVGTDAEGGEGGGDVLMSQDWKYKGEGASNVVVEYSGPDHPLFVRDACSFIPSCWRS